MYALGGEESDGETPDTCDHLRQIDGVWQTHWTTSPCIYI